MSTMKDVAREAGLSVASVSRYIANPGSVNPDTARAIQAAIEKLNYRMDYSAKSLKTGKYYNIAIVLYGLGPFYWNIISNIEYVLLKAGYFYTVYTRNLHMTDYKINLPLFKKRHVDGIVFFPHYSEEDDVTIRELKAMGEKFVVVDREINDDSIYQCYIDNYAAGKMAATVLLNQGHRKFLFIWGMKFIASAVERFNGFRDQLKEAGIKLTEDRQIPGHFSGQVTYDWCKEHFRSLPEFTAVFASNDSSAAGFMKYAHSAGLRCPDHYSIIGFDNDTDFSPFMIPGLSSFSQPLDLLGASVAQTVLDLIDGNNPPLKKIILQANFIPRASLAPLSRA
ncbi:MAG: LacI family DNA-binding transcriptional regulator [Spirochaetales bacterium]|nr:LacI family DNA-binding transcriptional regulator [Spirochaetales bacterium]